MAKTSAKAMTRAELQRKACGLRMKAWSYPRIAAELGIAVGTAYNYVAAQIKADTDAASETGDQIRNQMLDQLDAAMSHCLAVMANPEITDANRLAAVSKIVSVHERRAKLLGLDGAIKVSVDESVLALLTGDDDDV